MSTIIPFRRRAAAALPIPAVEPADHRSALLTRGVTAFPHEARDQMQEGDIERHWGVALALASWPLCLGASIVLATL